MAFLTAFFSFSVNSSGFATGVLAGILGSLSSAMDGVLTPTSDEVFLFSSVADALTFVPGLVISAGTVTLPSLSMVILLSVPSASSHLLSSPLVTLTSLGLPSLSVYLMVTVLASLSFGGVTVMLPSLFLTTSGAAGACLSSDVTVFPSEVLSPSLAIALTSVSFLILSVGMLIRPESLSTVTPSTAGSIFQLPSSPFLAITVFSFPLGSL